MAPSLCPSIPQAAHVGFLALSLMVRNSGIDRAENSVREDLPSVLNDLSQGDEYQRHRTHHADRRGS